VNLAITFVIYKYIFSTVLTV